MREREEYVKLREFYTKRETTFEDQQGKINVNNYINLVTGSRVRDRSQANNSQSNA